LYANDYLDEHHLSSLLIIILRIDVMGLT
jgi:hypothetical protein